MAANVTISTVAVPALSCREIRDWDELERLRPDWIRFLRANTSLGLFSTPEWLAPWWQAYSEGRELRTLVVTDAAEGVVAILPMYIEKAKPLLPVAIRRLRLVGDGSGDSDDLDVVVQAGFEEPVVDAFVTWARTSDWDVCELNCVSPRSTFIQLLQDRISRAGWKQMIGRRPTCVVPLPPSWEQYLKELSAKERRKIGHRLRHLEARYKVEFVRCEQMEDLPHALNALFTVHQKRWNQKGLPGAFSSAERREFYHKMAAAMLSKRQLELWLLKLNGEPVSGQIAMRYGVRMHALQEGFDPAFAADSVGYVLRSQMLRYCIENGVREYDFLAGDQESKQRWGAITGSYTSLHFANPGSRGDMHIALATRARVVKDWLRQHVPEKTFARAQQSRIARRLLGAE